MYIIEAAAEYMVALTVGGTFFATITQELGFSDSLTGILGAFASLGCLCQLLSMAFRPRRTKGFVIGASVLNQLLFALWYIIPLSGAQRPVKTVTFVGAVLAAQIIYNIAHPKKITWMMSMVDEHKRGSFTAVKEAVSLIAGMVFTYTMGSLIDSYRERGEIRTAFIIAVIVILFFSAVHTVSMLLTMEKTPDYGERKKLWQNIRTTLTDKKLLKVVALFVLYTISRSGSAFNGTYQINELGFSLQYISIMGIVSSVARIAASIVWGKYADRQSFLAMMEKCLFFVLASDVFVMISQPSIGRVTWMIASIFSGIASGGINSALVNVIFDCVPMERRSDSLAISQSLSGVVGFVATLSVSPLLAHLQEVRNETGEILGMPIYAQQVLVAGGAVLLLAVILYLRFCLIKHAVPRLPEWNEVRRKARAVRRQHKRALRKAK